LARLPDSRSALLVAVPALVGLIFALDLGWAISSIYTGSIFYGLVDEPAHFATGAIALSLVALSGRTLERRFVVAALVASVAIDLDHVPQHFGLDFLTAGTSRPYLHCALGVLIPALAAVALPKWRPVLLGIAFGFAVHLVRDLVTGPGVPLALPFSEASVRLPYLLYAGALGAAAAACLLAIAQPRLRATRAGFGSRR
jgi:inner membrane protein